MSNRAELEDRWRARLKEAELRLRLARAYVYEVQADDALAASQSADGVYAYQRALNLESLAINDYRRILQIFGDLVVHHKVPDENEWISPIAGPAE
jgi:hypothetical protein